MTVTTEGAWGSSSMIKLKSTNWILYYTEEKWVQSTTRHSLGLTSPQKLISLNHLNDSFTMRKFSKEIACLKLAHSISDYKPTSLNLPLYLNVACRCFKNNSINSSCDIFASVEVVSSGPPPEEEEDTSLETLPLGVVRSLEGGVSIFCAWGVLSACSSFVLSTVAFEGVTGWEGVGSCLTESLEDVMLWTGDLSLISEMFDWSFSWMIPLSALVSVFFWVPFPTE